MGINIATPLDWEEDRLYADVIRMSREFKSGQNANSLTLARVDANGWPMSDFAFIVWADMDKMHGTYTLSFNGQASVSASPGGNISIKYDALSNTSTGTIQYSTSANSTLSLSFSNTKRSNSSATGTGVTSIKLMRPLTPGSSQSYPASTLFNDPIKVLISKFSVVRYMDFLSTNGSVQSSWSDRPLPTWASFQRNPGGAYGWQGIGGPLEHVILLSNEVGKDAWINIPVDADDAYILNVARLFAYGSDGINPYFSTQPSPIYPPLDSSLRLYVEYSNELWNSGGPFPQFHDNCQAASAELASTSGNSPLNWDGVWNNVQYSRSGSNNNWNWSMCWRRPVKRGVEISNIFRSVFGDAAMMTRVRPMLMTQLSFADGMLFDATKMLLSYYNNMDGSNMVPVTHPPYYYFYGAGGSGYYDPQNPGVTSATALFADPGMQPQGYTNQYGPAGFRPWQQDDAKYVAALGLKRVAYEGGPNLETGVNVNSYAVTAAAVTDPRMKTAMVDMHDEWSKDGGDLFVYYRATGDYQWGFTPDVYNLGTPKLQAIDALNRADHAALTFGTLAPGSVAGSAADVCSTNSYSCSSNSFTADGSKLLWASYTFRSAAAASWKVDISVTNPSNAASVAIYVDGTLVGAQNVSGGGLVSLNAGSVEPGMHGVIVRAVAGTFSIGTVAVTLN